MTEDRQPTGEPWMLPNKARYGGEEVSHEPLLEINGKPISGLKRCKYCGLSETYWDRWPTCDEVPRLKRTPEEIEEHIFKRWSRVLARLAKL